MKAVFSLLTVAVVLSIGSSTNGGSPPIQSLPVPGQSSNGRWVYKQIRQTVTCPPGMDTGVVTVTNGLTPISVNGFEIDSVDLSVDKPMGVLSKVGYFDAAPGNVYEVAVWLLVNDPRATAAISWTTKQ